MKRITALLLISIIIPVFISCKKLESDKNLSYYKECANSQIAIERIRKADKPDWGAIKKHYEVCAKLIKEIDSKFNTNYKTEIPIAIEKCSKDEKARINQQTLAKGLQHVIVLKIRDLVSTMGKADNKTRKNISNEISALFNGIRPTFVRRDKDFSSGKKLLEAEVDRAIDELKKSADSDYITAANALDNAINKTYALSVLYEIQSIEKLRDSDIEKCDVKKAEAIIFYRIIKEKMEKSDRKSHKSAMAIINAEYSAVNSKLLLEALNKGLSIKIL